MLLVINILPLYSHKKICIYILPLFFIYVYKKYLYILTTIYLMFFKYQLLIFVFYYMYLSAISICSVFFLSFFFGKTTFFLSISDKCVTCFLILISEKYLSRVFFKNMYYQQIFVSNNELVKFIVYN